MYETHIGSLFPSAGFFPTYEVQVVVVVQLEGEGEGEHNLQMATMDQCEFHA